MNNSIQKNQTGTFSFFGRKFFRHLPINKIFQKFWTKFKLIQIIFIKKFGIISLEKLFNLSLTTNLYNINETS